MDFDPQVRPVHRSQVRPGHMAGAVLASVMLWHAKPAAADTGSPSLDFRSELVGGDDLQGTIGATGCVDVELLLQNSTASGSLSSSFNSESHGATTTASINSQESNSSANGMTSKTDISGLGSGETIDFDIHGPSLVGASEQLTLSQCGDDTDPLFTAGPFPVQSASLEWPGAGLTLGGGSTGSGGGSSGGNPGSGGSSGSGSGNQPPSNGAECKEPAVPKRGETLRQAAASLTRANCQVQLVDWHAPRRLSRRAAEHHLRWRVVAFEAEKPGQVTFRRSPAGASLPPGTKLRPEERLRRV